MGQRISIHAPHAGSDMDDIQAPLIGTISIHAPHAGSDAMRLSNAAARHNFNPRSPCGERRTGLLVAGLLTLFQSTLPMRGATEFVQPSLTVQAISIHAPHAGSDSLDGKRCVGAAISIHAPHAGSDGNGSAREYKKLNFNPRSPCGERQQCVISSNIKAVFQSTLPMRGATV